MTTYVPNIFNSIICFLDPQQLQMVFTSQSVLNFSRIRNKVDTMRSVYFTPWVSIYSLHGCEKVNFYRMPDDDV